MINLKEGIKNLVNIVINYSSVLGCKVTTFFPKLYQLPMEKMKRKENRKRLQINELLKTARHTLWKVSNEGMEKNNKCVAFRAERLTVTGS